MCVNEQRSPELCRIQKEAYLAIFSRECQRIWSLLQEAFRVSVLYVVLGKSLYTFSYVLMRSHDHFAMRQKSP